MRDLIFIDFIFRLVLPLITLILFIQSHTKPVKSFAIRFNSDATRLYVDLSHFSRNIDFLSLLSSSSWGDLFCQKWAKNSMSLWEEIFVRIENWKSIDVEGKKYNFWIPQQRWRWDDNNFRFLASDEWNMRSFTVRAWRSFSLFGTCRHSISEFFPLNNPHINYVSSKV